MSKPRVLLAGGGAAGLWSALALLDVGWPGRRLTVIEPEPKQGDDHTWGYWARAPLLDAELHVSVADAVVLRDGRREVVAPTAPYRYYSLRSSAFYASAKRRLNAAGVTWTRDRVTDFGESRTEVVVSLEQGSPLTVDYVLDSRTPTELAGARGNNATLQHFGGYYVEARGPCFDPGRVTFMDFVPAGPREVAFFYVVPQSRSVALVELAVLSREPWRQAAYDARLDAYLEERYAGVDFAVREREYGVIPMSDARYWRRSTARVWTTGTRGGWVQPSSGYAFARTARFARATARQLGRRRPRPVHPGLIDEVFEATMLRHVTERPESAAEVFVDLFIRNGAPRAFAFLDGDAAALETLRLMWNSPRRRFSNLALREMGARLAGLRG